MEEFEIIEYLESECQFRDFEFRPMSEYHKYTTIQWHIKNPNRETLEKAVSNFCQRGGGTIYIYLDEK